MENREDSCWGLDLEPSSRNKHKNNSKNASRNNSKNTSRNRLSIVGIGPGRASLRTRAATEAILEAESVVGYRPYLELISDLLPGKSVYSSGMGGEVERVRMAVDLSIEGPVALVSSGDPNVYGMAGLGLEMADSPARVLILPGVTSFTAAACRAGLFFRESVAVISLSDLLTPWQEIEGRLRQAAEFQIPVALYNPRSRKRDWQLLRALDICGERDVLIAKDIGRKEEKLFWATTAQILESEALRDAIDMTTLVILLGRGTYRGERGKGAEATVMVEAKVEVEVGAEAKAKAEVNLVGTGPGGRANLTGEVESILQSSEKLFGAQRYLDQIGDYPGEKVSHLGPCPERSCARFQEAKKLALGGKRSSILTGGDPSIFSAGWRIMDLARDKLPVHIAPGVSAFSSVAARAGAPLVNDFVLLSQPGEGTQISLLAAAGFGVVVYNVKGHEVVPLLQDVDPERPIVLARDVARQGEEMIVLKAEELVDIKPSGYRFTLLVSCPNARICEGRIIAKRGYEAKYSY